MSKLAHERMLYTVEQLELRKKRKEEGKKQAHKFRVEVVMKDAAKARKKW